MKKKLIIYCPILFLIICFSLNKNLLKYYYRISKYTGIVVFNNDLCTNCKTVCLYQKGKIEKETNFSGKLKQGWEINYYSSGIVEKKTFYEHNIAEKVQYRYYPNGNLNYKSNILHGKRYGDFFWYLQSGRLDTYAAFDITGQSFCSVKYNNSGTPISLEGNIISSVFYLINNNKVELVRRNGIYHSVSELLLTLAVPPNEDHYLLIASINDINKNLSISGNTIKIKSEIIEAGNYKIEVFSYIKDPTGKFIKAVLFTGFLKRN